MEQGSTYLLIKYQQACVPTNNQTILIDDVLLEWEERDYSKYSAEKIKQAMVHRNEERLKFLEVT